MLGEHSQDKEDGANDLSDKTSGRLAMPNYDRLWQPISGITTQLLTQYELALTSSTRPNAPENCTVREVQESSAASNTESFHQLSATRLATSYSSPAWGGMPSCSANR